MRLARPCSPAQVHYPGSGAKGEIWSAARPFTPSIEMGLAIPARLYGIFRAPFLVALRK